MKQIKAITGDLVSNLANDTNIAIKQQEGHQVFVSEAKRLTDSLTPDVKRMFNDYIEQLFALKPTIKRQLKTDTEVRAYKQQFVLALSQAKIDTPQKLEIGLDYARLDSKHPFVDIGLFVSWCKEGYAQVLKEEMMQENMQRIKDQKFLLGAKPFEERKAEAKANINSLRNIIKQNK